MFTYIFVITAANKTSVQLWHQLGFGLWWIPWVSYYMFNIVESCLGEHKMEILLHAQWCNWTSWHCKLTVTWTHLSLLQVSNWSCTHINWTVVIVQTVNSTLLTSGIKAPSKPMMRSSKCCWNSCRRRVSELNMAGSSSTCNRWWVITASTVKAFRTTKFPSQSIPSSSLLSLPFPSHPLLFFIFPLFPSLRSRPPKSSQGIWVAIDL